MSHVPKVGVGVLILKGEKILLLKRKGAHGAGEWSPPGGHLEFGESFEECALRETREETGLAINNVRFIALTNDIFRESDLHYITIWMEGGYVCGKPSVSAPNEMEEVNWFPLDCLPQPLFLPLKNLIEGKGYSSRPRKEG